MYRASAKDSGAGTAGIGGGPPAIQLEPTLSLASTGPFCRGGLEELLRYSRHDFLFPPPTSVLQKRNFHFLRSAADGNFIFGFVVLPILLSCVSFSLGRFWRFEETRSKVHR